MSELPVAGVRIGHWTGAGTGVTVLLLPDGTVGSAEVRGGAPATREVDVLDPTRTVGRVDAVVLAGGSAFGLAAADGVMRVLEAEGRGYPTAAGPVPIVPALAIFDLLESRNARPGAAEGREAAVAAFGDGAPVAGRVGAGRGATVGKWRGREHAVPGGLGISAVPVDGAQVVAVAVVNAVGDVVADDGRVIAGTTAPPGTPAFPADRPFEEGAARSNTTLAVVATDARLDKAGCHLVAQSAHDGMSRSIRPAHTRYDGDVVVALATGAAEANLDRVREAAADAVAAAVRSAVGGG